MQPSVIYERLAANEALAGLIGTTSPIADNTRIYELQSLKERPKNVDTGYFIIIDMQESDIQYGRATPRMMQIWVHGLLEWSPDYGKIVQIQNQIDRVILPLVHQTGTDGIRLTQIRAEGRSRNLTDPGWKTATRNALYGVLYDEFNI
jgi:hypothetical protein